ncbi:NAD(P)H-dependent oxidoreductase [Vagococcus luciliae]|uniref:Glutathione-regulated potassium-efflux system ancillary protein KefG n=1 Tax=Vagococcus luciliae TaxID=2920380 RepID=A0ABY5P286_9ENTE|nr:NAD(P)H-dependent oxidoreductase [Vagococcus luciliae]UUV99771.1 Glutathione-regulated potassium-efflux system ancillary protein KefG [Vagococcus luciliae]
MKTLVVIAHPNSHESGLQSFLKESCASLSSVEIYDIQEELSTFDLVKTQELLKKQDRIIFQFPMYWYAAPDILYKWLEKVLTTSLYKDALKDKELGIVINMGQKLSSFQAGASEHFTISELLRPFQAIAYKCQMIYLTPFPIALFSYLKENDKKQLLINYQHYLTKEKDSRFSVRENWAIKRLVELEQKQVIKDEENRLSSIRDALEENRLELDSLLMTLEEMRDE